MWDAGCIPIRENLLSVKPKMRSVGSGKPGPTVRPIPGLRHSAPKTRYGLHPGYPAVGRGMTEPPAMGMPTKNRHWPEADGALRH